MCKKYSYGGAAYLWFNRKEGEMRQSEIPVYIADDVSSSYPNKGSWLEFCQWRKNMGKVRIGSVWSQNNLVT